MNLHNFTSGASINKPQTALTLDQLRILAPSAFATEKHSSRSDRYTYIPTSAVIEGMIKAGFRAFSAKQSRSRIEGKAEFTKHIIRFRGENYSDSIVVGDVVPEVVVMNSHDGTSTYQISAGFFRLVCSNGLMVAEGMQDSIRVPHKGNIIDQVIEGSNRIVNGSQPAIQAIETWNRLELSAGEQLAFAEAAHTLRFADAEGKTNTPITAEQLLRPRRSADAKNDLWVTMNRVQENVIKGGLHGVQRGFDQRGRATRRNVTTRTVNGIDQDTKLNRALWTLAERMAELKGVGKVA